MVRFSCIQIVKYRLSYTNCIAEALWEKNCTMNMTEFTPGQSWSDGDCNRCMCKRDGTVLCEPRTCPQLSCAFMVKKDGECCPVCLSKLYTCTCTIIKLHTCTIFDNIQLFLFNKTRLFCFYFLCKIIREIVKFSVVCQCVCACFTDNLKMIGFC
jgi:hypothetical protein